MILTTTNGTPWPVERAAEKLALRAQLPGARVFDLAANALRNAKRAGLPAADRFTLALPASWLVNSPAISRVLRRWALPPQRDQWLALLSALEGGPAEWVARGDREAVIARVAALGDEPFAVEAISKVLALLVPELVPLLPIAARAFVLGEGEHATAESFVAILDWFAEAVSQYEEALAAIARAYAPAPLDAAQVLDRLLWFDSEGHRLFAPLPPQG